MSRLSSVGPSVKCDETNIDRHTSFSDHVFFLLRLYLLPQFFVAIVNAMLRRMTADGHTCFCRDTSFPYRVYLPHQVFNIISVFWRATAVDNHTSFLQSTGFFCPMQRMPQPLVIVMRM